MIFPATPRNPSAARAMIQTKHMAAPVVPTSPFFTNQVSPNQALQFAVSQRQRPTAPIHPKKRLEPLNSASQAPMAKASKLPGGKTQAPRSPRPAARQESRNASDDAISAAKAAGSQRRGSRKMTS